MDYDLGERDACTAMRGPVHAPRLKYHVRTAEMEYCSEFSSGTREALRRPRDAVSGLGNAQHSWSAPSTAAEGPPSPHQQAKSAAVS